MAAPALYATGFVRLALRPIVLYLSIISISLMTMVNPAHASGNVQRTTLWCSHEYNPASCMYSTKEEACIALAADNPLYNYNPKVVYSGGWFVGYRCYGQYVGTTSYYSLGWLIKGGACPSNSTYASATSCTCNTSYLPDSAGTSCVPANNCPANMSGSPCACIPGGYVLNPNGAGCVQEQYIISEPQDQTQLPDVEPGKPREVTARVTIVQTGQPKQGAVVRFHLDVDLTSGGHDHGEAHGRRSRGTISSSNCVAESGGTPDTYDCTTGAEGYTGFTFNAPDASGTHTFTATCISHACSGSKIARVNVKVDGLQEIPETAAWVLIKKPGATHRNGHYLNAAAMTNLRLLAGNYTLNFPLQYLHLNDASLEWGGRFDINGDWTSPHGKHQRGVVIDVRANDDTGATGAIPLSSFASFITMAASIKRGIGGIGIEAQAHCTSNQADGQNRHPPACIGSDGSQDSNRHFHILLLGVDQ